MIKVIRGNPTPEELAAAVTVVQARAAAAEGAGRPSTAQARAAWSSPARITRHPLPAPSPGAWARTYWPG
ncbi:acyl-CoA carboxylase subunit epsilon [Streptomyces sp. NPDC088725]|uniref:acyl-CoA carboxylase subunit epsilon n=1 Tax=Streptomyces sp. NPDC088725 TaxID=3365873 RepID=UPI00380EEC0C